MIIKADEATELQIAKILNSEALRTSEVLRILLRYLADKSLSGEGNQIKEYSIAIDALGKPSTYDPRHDSTVRIHVGRLRQKLTEYYQTEGRDDPIVVDLPKGRFVLTWHQRSPSATTESMRATVMDVRNEPSNSRRALVIVLGLATVCACALYGSLRLLTERRQISLVRNQWTPAMEEFWSPFLTADRPLLIVVSVPLFVRLQGFGAVRDGSLDREADIPSSQRIMALQKALKIPAVEPFYYWAAAGEIGSSFMLGRLLGTRVQHLSIVKSSELSWAQLSDNNVLFIESRNLFSVQMRGPLPANEELVPEDHGFRDLKPSPGSPEHFVDDFKNWTDGEVYALISHLPGGLGKGDYLFFGSRHSAGRFAAVQWLTDAGHTQELFDKMKMRSGHIPRYYQILVKAKFKAGTLVETSYILHRELPSS